MYLQHVNCKEIITHMKIVKCHVLYLCCYLIEYFYLFKQSGYISEDRQKRNWQKSHEANVQFYVQNVHFKWNIKFFKNKTFFVTPSRFINTNIFCYLMFCYLVTNLSMKISYLITRMTANVNLDFAHPGFATS